MIDLLRTELSPLYLSDIAINALPIMEEYKVGQIPILDDKKKLIGLVDESSILNMTNLQDSLGVLKHDLKNISVSKKFHIFHAIKVFYEHKVSLIPIVNKDHTYLGYILPSDIICKIGHMSQNDVNTSILTLSVKTTDYSLHEVSRLIEENNGKIISLWSVLTDDRIDIHILIKCANIKIIIQTIERYDYTVTQTLSNNIETDQLDDRFESFIKYLNP